MKGRFITLEGIDGVGKSTQHGWLVDTLRGQGVNVVSTREPGGTPLGESLRQLLLSESMHPETEALLMFAARREHVAKVIEPALAKGDWVICDRFVDASFAYQSGGRGLEWSRIEQLARWVLGDLQPDLTFFFDAPVQTAQKRLNAAAVIRDRFEQEREEFFERVRMAYLRLAQENPGRIRVIDATKSLDEVHNQLDKVISTF